MKYTNLHLSCFPSTVVVRERSEMAGMSMALGVMVMLVSVFMRVATGQCVTDNDAVEPIFLPVPPPPRIAIPPRIGTTPPHQKQSETTTTTTTTTEAPTVSSRLINSYNLSTTTPFHLELFKHLTSQQQYPTNLVLSPLSIWAGVGLTGLGAAGGTLGQVLAVLGSSNKVHLLATLKALNTL